MSKDQREENNLLTSKERRQKRRTVIRERVGAIKAKFGIERLRRVGIVVAAFVVAFSSVRIAMFYSVENKKISTAKSVVKLLYDFSSQEQLKEQQVKLKQFVTNDVYNQLTVDNEQRRLNTYLKFGSVSSTVVFRKVTSDYVIYSLDSAILDEDRKFVFFYKIGTNGKISSLEECELIDFIPDSVSTDTEVE